MDVNVDRKVVLALAAKKLLSAISDFIRENEEMMKLVLGKNQEEARAYLTELAIDACEFIKTTKGK